MATTYTDKAPGVYVVEKLSSAPIAGVGTSTAGFIGIISTGETSTTAISGEVNKAVRSTPKGKTKQGEDTSQAQGDSSPAASKDESVSSEAASTSSEAASTSSDFYWLNSISLGKAGTGDGTTTKFTLAQRLNPDVDLIVKINDQDFSRQAKLEQSNGAQVSTLVLEPAPEQDAKIFFSYRPKSVQTKEVKLCTNFSEFKTFFGDFIDPEINAGQNILTHAVYGFFRNGGTRCYVTWVSDVSEVASTLEEKFEPIDEIAIVVAPAEQADKTVQQAIADHCKKMGDRFAILDSPSKVELSEASAIDQLRPFTSDFAALYFPWIEVYDPATKATKQVPPSGHMAGLYARVDAKRGVHKAPANESLVGATGVTYAISKAKQGPLNQVGINCIRQINGNTVVWGARTLGGDANGQFKYISTRRLFNYLAESIDKGTQWTVFEPNSPELWAAIRRTVSAFLTQVWRSGALFGALPEEAFYVKCDAETNPPDQRELGQVTTEIGVAVVKPAEYVVFNLSHWLQEK